LTSLPVASTFLAQVPRVSLLADLEDFLARHRPHGGLVGDAGEPRANGYEVTVACACGVTFVRWITPAEAAEELAVLGGMTQVPWWD